MIQHILAATLGGILIYSGRYRNDFRKAGEQYGWYAVGILTIVYALLNIVHAQIDLGKKAGVVDYISTIMIGMGLGMLLTMLLVSYGRKKIAEQNPLTEPR
ncbi:MAG: hypothetical protein JJU29_15715 [Verrucomicrobia bacterium]|nr:hypothetical protein [Verrucomicrobiota bacterium]MCH8513991.1 hypothetical protein [Kiritimatiellia bacterium]